jgi:hypothetical protein
MNISVEGYWKTKQFSQQKFDRFVSQQVKKMQKLRAKGHRDWLNVSDEVIQSLALKMANSYDAGAVWR